MTFDPSEKELETLNSGRLLRAEADLLLPMLERQKDAAVGKLIQFYRAGELNNLPMCAAELATIENMKSEIKQKITKAEIIERKVYANTDRD